METQTRGEERERCGAVPRVPVAVQSYRDSEGWKQTEITETEEWAIQHAMREKGAVIVAECLEDAQNILKTAHEMGIVPRAATPKNALELAMFLAERRIVHVSRVYDEFLTKKIAESRKALGCLEDKLVVDYGCSALKAYLSRHVSQITQPASVNTIPLHIRHL